MKILSNSQIRNLDQLTIQSEPISSINLMERAGRKIADWILQAIPDPRVPFHIFCGPGNNGGDGLVVARLLELQHRPVTVYVCLTAQLSYDSKTNLDRLPRRRYLKVVDIDNSYVLPTDGIIIDALFGNGLNRPLGLPWAKYVEEINSTKLSVISIDLPSGLFADSLAEGPRIRSDYTLCLHTPKLAFYQKECATDCGIIQILDIGLHKPTLEALEVKNHLVTREDIASLLPTRNTFDHKGTFGHALLICGGYGKVGAAILAARACLRAGVGKLTVHIPKSAYQVLQLAVPEAMTEIDNHDFWFTSCEKKDPYETIGIGCGIGTKHLTAQGLKDLIENYEHPLVLDADALNILSQNKIWLNHLPAHSVLTPHPGEYMRLFGEYHDSFDRLENQRQLSIDYNMFVVYKQAYTCTTTPGGLAFFNSTGNPGMGTAGAGDVLTGMITGLAAQGIPVLDAVITAVYIHGLAGDLAAEKFGQQSMIAGDIIDQIGAAICKTKSDVKV
ncbi:MAG: NAD(P)H-hydrate dehydratase [Saprospiraceae bacterium]|nr:NAD(P)H-hydrate dehydratase [Saprospiraceae bacterium]